LCVKKYNFKINALVGFIVQIGNRIVNFACSNNFSISRTYFPHKIIHKQTWQSPDGKRVTQTDHVLINKRHGTDIQCMGSLREWTVIRTTIWCIVSISCKYQMKVRKGNYKLEKFNKIILNTKKNERRYNSKFTEKEERKRRMGMMTNGRNRTRARVNMLHR